MTRDVLECERLHKSFGGVQAVGDVNLKIQENQVCALIGPNGAGKSTLVGLVCGRFEPDAGRIVFDGQDITTLPAHARIRLGIAYTFQITSIFADLPVCENVALAARRALATTGLPRRTYTRARAVRHRVAASLEQVGLSDLGAHRAGDLAYGHQRLLEVAMGLAQAPRLFIMDEPTQGLALQEIENFKTLLAELAGSTTILLIEHNMDVVMGTAHRVAVLDAGSLIAQGTPEEVRADRRVQAAYLGTSTEQVLK